MLTMYLDESIQGTEGFVVVAGFLGNDDAWNDCMRRWKPALGLRSSLHMASLTKWNTDRNREMLANLGSIPEASGLTLVYSSLKVSDYSDLVKGTLSSLFSEGYLIALFMLISRAMIALPPEERIEVICEQQIQHAALRESMFQFGANDPGWKTPSGVNRLAKWSSMKASMILEPSDYASYALMQRLIDPCSRKSELCAPILSNSRQIGACMDRDEVRWGIETSNAVVQGQNIAMDKQSKMILRAAFKEKYGN